MYSVSLMEYNTTPTSDIPTPSTDELYIFDPLTTDEGLMLTEPVLNLESSSAGSFNCNIPETNYGYGKIIKRRTRVVVRKDDKVIFMGRINSEDRDLYLSEKIEAEGALAYLNDSLTEKKTYSYKSLPFILNDVFTHHNSKFSNEPWKQFNFPYDITTDTSTNCKAEFTGRDDTNVESKKITQYNVNFSVTMEIVTELLDIANAVLKIDYNDVTGKWDVYIYKKYDYATDGSNFPVNKQPIEFGVNLIDLMQSYDDTDICSSVAPFGGDLIQESKEIGVAIAGKDITETTAGGDVIAEWYPNTISVRNPNGEEPWDYFRASAVDPGYWVFGLYIDNYNAKYPNTPLKRLYISWRGYKFTTHSGEPAGEGMIEDCAWRIYDAAGYTLGYHAFSEGGFDGEINELIDLTKGEYRGAAHIVVSGWGGAITPLIRRDAIVVEENDKLNISKCDVMGSSATEDLVHEADSFYLYSKSLVNSIGMIEKKLEYNIEDSLRPVSSDVWYLPYSANGHDDFNFNTTGDGKLGAAKEYDGYALGYIVGKHGDEPDMEMNKGNYQIVPFGVGYKCIQYRLPSLGNKDRPRGVYISCRMHKYGIYDNGTTVYEVEGMYAVYDDAWQVLSYKAADEPQMGKGWYGIVDEYIDLSLPQYYGAKYIRVGGWGSGIEVKCVPTDDEYARNRLLAQAELYLTSSQWEKCVIEATAVDLNMLNDEFEKFDICTLIEVVSDYHGIYTYLPLTKLEIHLDNYANNSIKVGYDSDSYLSYQLNESIRATSVEESIEERRKNNEYTS